MVMRSVIVRKLPDDHYLWLRKRAARHGRSMESEMRAIVAAEKLRAENWLTNLQALVASQTADSSKAPESPRRSRKPKALRGKLPVDEVVARLQELAAKATKKRKSKKLLSEEFLEERRRMWGEG